MKYRLFGKTDLKISEIGFGTWGIGGRAWGKKDDEKSKKALNLALDMGINFFDTAYVYGEGHSEELIGQVLQGRHLRTKVILATKIPPYNFVAPKPGCLFRKAFPKRWIRETTETSLKRLKADYVDLQQLHMWFPEWVHEEDWIYELEKLKREGKIRWLGISVSDASPDTVIGAVKTGLIDSVQVIYNIFAQAPTRKLFQWCLNKKVAVIVRSPLEEGALSGTFKPRMRFQKNDWRQNYFKGDYLVETCRRVERLKEFLGEEASSLSELALKFCLSHSAVSTVIPGMRRPEHVRRNVAAVGEHCLSAKTLQRLKKHAWSDSQ